MVDTINIPGAGPIKKQYVMLGGAGALGVIGYAWWKRSGERADAATPAEIDPDYLLPETDRTPVVGDSGGDYDETDPSRIDTNAEWTQAASEYLVATGGWDAALIATALGKFLAHKPLSEQETQIVLAARGAFGEPPQGGPFNVIPTLPTPPKPGTGNGVVIPAVGSLTATPGKRRATIRWTFPGTPSIGGFLLKITDLSTGHSQTKNIGARSRSYTFTASRGWRGDRTVQFYIRAFRGGFSDPHKVYGPGKTVSAKLNL